MAVKLTKNELKTQKDQLKQFERYLPTLQLKKQQLQLVIRQIYAELDEKTKERKRMIGNLDDWVAVFAENTLFEDSKKIENLVIPKSVESKTENIAGVQIPVFENLTFEPIEYEVEDYPLWVDTALIKLREIARLDALVKVLQKRADLLQKELQTTSHIMWN